MNPGSLRSRITPTVEYDAFGQVIISEAGGRYSLRSRSSSEGVSKSVHGSDDARSQGSADRRAPINGNVQADLVDRPATLRSATSSRYRRSGDAVGDEAPATVVSGTISTADSSSLARQIRRQNQQRKHDTDSESDSTTRYSDFSRRHAKRHGGRRRKNRRKKKRKGRSIDKHSDTSASRRYSAADGYDVGGPDNEYWRELVEQRRRSSLDSSRRGRRGSKSLSPQRRRFGLVDGDGDKSPPRVNGASPPQSVGTGSVSHFGGSGNGSVGRLVRRQSSGTSNVDRGRCGSVVLPMAIFVVVGCLLIVIGIIRIFICFWHEFGCSVWTGALLLVFGCIHIMLARQYDKHIKTLLYIVVGVMTSVAVLIATAFSLLVLVPTLSQVTAGVDDSLDARVLSAVNFSKYATNETVTGVDSVTWPSVVLDSSSLLLLTVALYSQTATLIAVDRYWHHNYKSTGDCRYRGPPRLCNPIDQMSVGQAAIFVGLVEITMLEYVPGHDSSSPHIWSLVWSGALLIVAGFAGLCYGKRTDSTTAGVVSIALMSCSLLGCGATIVLTTLSIVKDADRLRITVAAIQDPQSSPPYNLTNLIALVAVQGIADCISAVGVLFVASNLYRQLNKLCFHTSATRMDTTHQMSISSPTYRPQVVVSTSL